MSVGFAPFTPVGTGALALEPRAFGALFPVTGAADTELRDGVAVVRVTGPLMHHASPCFDSYDAITARFTAALATAPKAVVLSLDSPGGMVAGCFETARALRSMARAAGVRFVAYVDGSACSAAYALACAADEIVVPATGAVGSIGVIEVLRDQTALDSAMGLRFQLVTSGSRKPDGNPHVAVSDAAVAATTTAVNQLAGIFFDLVQETRGVSVDEVRAMDGAVVLGTEAVSRRLADRVGTLTELLAMVASGALESSEEVAMTEDEKARAALQAILDDEGADEKAKARAKKALAAMDEESEPEPEKAKAEDSDEEKDEDESPAAVAAKALAEVHKMRAQMAEKEIAIERRELLASRPDFAPELVASLQKAPIGMVREMVKTLPRTALRPAAAATVPVTLGEGQGDAVSAPGADPDMAWLDRAMGLGASPTMKAERRGNTLYLGPAPTTEKSNG